MATAPPANVRGVPRVLLTPRWLVRHAVVLLLLAAFAGLAWWQAIRAGQGNLRSYAYAVEWPIFAVFVVYVWWKTVQDELHPERTKPRPTKEPLTVPVNTEIDDSDDPELAAYNRYLASLDAGQGKRAR